jgi:hypothetical protein
MKERPILFSGPMVRAILEGRKTQTRRMIKPEPDSVFGDEGINIPVKDLVRSHEVDYCLPKWKTIQCKYGQPGDRLWVRETWRKNPFPTGWPWEYRESAEEDMTPTDGPWKPSIHMPRVASRIVLEIEDVRIERLHEITNSDAWDEGAQPYKTMRNGAPAMSTTRDAFEWIWRDINGAASWDANPWVWVITFKRIEP